jgi:FtsH-binding integral membrane protein
LAVLAAAAITETTVQPEQQDKVLLVVMVAVLMLVVVVAVQRQSAQTNQVATAVLAVLAYRQVLLVQVFNALAAVVAVRNLAQAERQLAAVVQVQVRAA